MRPEVRKILPELLCLALGVFAVATEGFMIAGLLSTIADDLHTSLGVTGQLVLAFALTYALSSPILSAVTSGIERKSLITVAILVFGLANVFAALSENYPQLMACRIVLAIAAGVFRPAAQALAGQLVPSEMRGRALAFVNMGGTLGITLGVSVATFLGQASGWRVTFAIIAAISLIAALVLAARLPRVRSAETTSSVAERLALARTAGLLPILVATALWSTGVYTLFTYVGPLLDRVAGIPYRYLDVILFLYGLSTIVGAFVGGSATDKFGSDMVSFATLATLAVAFAAVSLIGYASVGAGIAAPSTLLLMLLCGVATWAFYASQQVRLLASVHQKDASIVLSLNASAMYFGFAAGAGLGGVVVDMGGVISLGWIGGLCEVVALAVLWPMYASHRATSPLVKRD
jgi:predicted MFS family arabinose efflux permease